MAAAREILPRFRTDLPVADKADSSPVTEADRGAESVMRDLIKKHRPAHGIIGEEYGKENENADFVWVLDPIDGTKSFIAGVPLFGTLIALLYQNTPVLGVIHQPVLNETWLGAAGMPTTLNGRPVHTRIQTDICKSTLFCTDVSMFENNDLTAFQALKSRAKLTRWSTDCYGYALVASGQADLVCEADMKLYDFAALVPVVENAGGVMSDWRGNPLNAFSDGHVLAAGNKTIQEQALRALNA